MREERGIGSDYAEHVVVCTHGIVIHEQVASEGVVIEVVGEIAHDPVKVVALLDDVAGEVFFAVPVAAVGFLEAVEFVVKLHVVVHGIQIVLVAQLAVFLDVVEVVLVEAALAVPLAGESLEVLEHQLRVFLVGVNRLAEANEVVVVVEAADVYPQAAERAVVVLAVSTAVDGGFTVAGTLVVCYGIFEFFDREVQVIESFFDSWSDVEFSEL